MELKDFVSETIKQIADGIREGHKYINDNKYGEGVRDDKAKEIKFDIAVSTDESNRAGVGGRITVATIFSAGADGESISKQSNVSRIQFRLLVHVNAG